MYKIFLDSSVIIAYLISGDSHHKDAASLLNFISEKYIQPYRLGRVFIINEIVLLETISKLIQNGHSFSKAKSCLDTCMTKYDITFVSRGGRGFARTVSKLYSDFSRRKFRKLQCNDFLIIADSIKCNALLVTCDGHFITKTAGKFKDAYFVSSRSKKHKDQYADLLRRFFKSI